MLVHIFDDTERSWPLSASCWMPSCHQNANEAAGNDSSCLAAPPSAVQSEANLKAQNWLFGLVLGTPWVSSHVRVPYKDLQSKCCDTFAAHSALHRICRQERLNMLKSTWSWILMKQQAEMRWSMSFRDKWSQGYRWYRKQVEVWNAEIHEVLWYEYTSTLYAVRYLSTPTWLWWSTKGTHTSTNICTTIESHLCIITKCIQPCSCI